MEEEYRGEDRRRKPDWFEKVEELFHIEPRWVRKQMYLIDHLEKQVEEVRLRCSAVEDKLDLIIWICKKLEEVPVDDIKPTSAKINMEDTHMADISVPDTNPPLSAVVAFADVHGHPATAQDVPQWSSSDPTVATVDASTDPAGLAAVVTILGPGATVIGVSSTDSDGTVITAAGTVTVTAGPPTSGEVSFS